jgi:hypothetical protein
MVLEDRLVEARNSRGNSLLSILALSLALPAMACATQPSKEDIIEEYRQSQVAMARTEFIQLFSPEDYNALYELLMENHRISLNTRIHIPEHVDFKDTYVGAEFEKDGFKYKVSSVDKKSGIIIKVEKYRYTGGSEYQPGDTHRFVHIGPDGGVRLGKLVEFTEGENGELVRNETELNQEHTRIDDLIRAKYQQDQEVVREYLTQNIEASLVRHGLIDPNISKGHPKAPRNMKLPGSHIYNQREHQYRRHTKQILSR